MWLVKPLNLEELFHQVNGDCFWGDFTITARRERRFKDIWREQTGWMMKVTIMVSMVILGQERVWR
jgi:hypothetical protein